VVGKPVSRILWQKSKKGVSQIAVVSEGGKPGTGTELLPILWGRRVPKTIPEKKTQSA